AVAAGAVRGALRQGHGEAAVREVVGAADGVVLVQGQQALDERALALKRHAGREGGRGGGETEARVYGRTGKPSARAAEARSSSRVTKGREEGCLSPSPTTSI